MRVVATGAVMAVLMAMTWPVAVRAEASLPLTVRLYNASGIPSPELVSARATAASLLQDAGLDVIFRLCGRRASSDEAIDPCEDRLTPSEVVVRVINAPAFSTTLHPDAYGVAYVVEETNRGWLATVFSDRIDEAATRVGVEHGTLLGRVIAHEVGHLLLGTGYHGEVGVMRAQWPDALLSHAGEDWRFSMREAARMHRSIAF